eukprot:1333206-Amorphochlora_amoeboformis.AAC.1
MKVEGATAPGTAQARETSHFQESRHVPEFVTQHPITFQQQQSNMPDDKIELDSHLGRIKNFSGFSLAVAALGGMGSVFYYFFFGSGGFDAARGGGESRSHRGPTRVLVVGGGIIGAMSALELGKRGSIIFFHNARDFHYLSNGYVKTVIPVHANFHRILNNRRTMINTLL